MRARLFCKTGEFRGATFQIENEARIGKSAENQIRLDSAVISSRHALLYFDSGAGRYAIEDLGSRNGTEVDGVALNGKELLDSLHVITFAGAHEFFFQMIQPAPVATPTMNGDVTERESPDASAPVVPPLAREVPRIDDGVTAPENAGVGRPSVADANATVLESPATVRPLAPPSNSADNYALEWSRPDASTRAVALKPGNNMIGRSKKCDVCIDDASVSREHAIISVENGTINIKELGSMRGTFVGGNKLVGETALKPGTDVIFGMVTTRLVCAASQATEGSS